MLIEITEIHPPKIGGKVSRIVAADGEQYDIWPEKLDGIKVGNRYQIEIKERDYNGRTFKSIKSIAPAPAAASTAAEPRPQGAAPACGEAEYVGRVVAALIAKGDLDKAKIPEATAWLRKLWREP